MEPVAQTAELLKQRALYMKEHRVLENTYNSERYNRLNRTVVIMPFLGSDMGAGHSLLQNRLNYLRACFWSFYHYYPHVVASVKSEKDRNYVR